MFPYLLVADDEAADVSADGVDLDHAGAVQAVDAVDGQLQGLGQVEGLVAGHQLEALAHLSIVETAVDG